MLCLLLLSGTLMTSCFGSNVGEKEANTFETGSTLKDSTESNPEEEFYLQNQVTLSDGIIYVENSDPFTEGLIFEAIPDEEGYAVVDYVGPAKDVVIPKIYRGFYVVRIADSAFKGITKLTSVSIPDSVTSIGSNAFNRCENLASIYLPRSVIKIGYHTFDDCFKLSTVYYDGQSANWEKIEVGHNSKLNSATLYYYSEKHPTTEGNYWHYVNGVPTKW